MLRLAVIGVAGLLMSVSLPGIAIAQDPRWGFDAAMSTIQDATSARNKIAPTGWGGRLFGAWFPARFITAGGDIGAYMHKDSLESSVLTTQGNKKSLAQIYELSAWAGFRTAPKRIDTTSATRFSAGLVGGYTASLGSQVRHESCVNCPERDITVSGGPFLEPSATLLFSTWALGLDVRSYLSGDRRRVIAMRFSFLM
jgi:hypothetical protein